MIRIKNRNYLYVTSDEKNDNELENSIISLIKELSKVVEGIKPNFLINRPSFRDKNNKDVFIKTKYAYIWFASKEVSNTILGKDIHGNELSIRDGDSEPSSAVTPTPSKFPWSKSWADMVDDEEEEKASNEV